jgi:hypothetical protein
VAGSDQAFGARNGPDALDDQAFALREQEPAGSFVRSAETRARRAIPSSHVSVAQRRHLRSVCAISR